MDHFHHELHSIKVPWPFKVTLVTLSSFLLLPYLNILYMHLCVFFKKFWRDMKQLFLTLKQIDHLLFHRGHIHVLSCEQLSADPHRKYPIKSIVKRRVITCIKMGVVIELH